MAVAHAVGWELLESGLLHIHNLLFFFTTSSSQEPSPLPCILGVFSILNALVTYHKIKGPATTITFLGVVIDTVRFELRLPTDKLTYPWELMRAWRGKRSGRCKNCESLLGHLLHVATVIRHSRVFPFYLFTILSATRSSEHFVHLDAIADADLLWWEFSSDSGIA